MALKILLYLLISTSSATFLSHVIEVDDVIFKKKEDVIQAQEIVNIQESQYYKSVYFDTIPVILKGVHKSQLTLYKKEYDQLPIQLKNSISQITITSQKLNSICGVSTSYSVKGCARSEYSDMFLDAKYRYGDLLHESIHLYSYQNDRVFSDEFISIYEEEGNRISVQKGNVHNQYEYFVSAYLLYLQDSRELMRICPKTKYFFDCC